MTQEGLASHHLHQRKRIYQKLETYPHPDPFKNFLDKIIYLIGFLGPIFTIPQAMDVWVRKDISGVSLFSWTAYVALAFVWLLYGIVHKEKPIILAYTLWIAVDLLIVVGVIIHN